MNNGEDPGDNCLQELFWGLFDIVEKGLGGKVNISIILL